MTEIASLFLASQKIPGTKFGVWTTWLPTGQQKRYQWIQKKGDGSYATGVVSTLEAAIDYANEHDEDASPFQLKNDPPPHRPARFENQLLTKQRALIDGLDYLPGQQDLF